VQALVAAQETAVSVDPHLTKGSVSCCQLCPFQRRAFTFSRPMDPTAMQNRLETHDTPLSALPRIAVSGVVWDFQAVPFHTSATARDFWALTGPTRDRRPAVCVEPTATQNVGDVHDSEVSVGLGRAAMGRSDQADPSQRSATAAIGPRRLIPRWSKPESEVPSAMQNVVDTHETPVSATFGGPLGPGTVGADQVAADAEVAAARLAIRPHSAAARKAPLPIPMRMSCPAHPTYNPGR
jgi:hypothetical protein